MRRKQKLSNAMEASHAETRGLLHSGCRPAAPETYSGISSPEARTDGERSVASGSSVAVCIAGMHRSGTSMVARLLHACALFLGPEEEFMPPSSANPEGYWENMHFVMLNERIMSQFGGWWGNPPSFPARWEFAPEVDSLFAEAEELVGRFRGHSSWGWKDPRSSLTLPFWRRVIPDLKLVVCVRNPLEVARSLSVRGDATSASQFFKLWLTYYRQLLSAIPPTQRIVTHYQSYFQDARAELRRLSDWLGLQASDGALESACAHVSAGLRHHHAMTAGLVAADVPRKVLRLYLSLCAEAGPVYRQLREREREAELERTTASASAPETYPRGPRVKQIERLHSLESKLAKRQALMARLHATPRAHKSELSLLNPLIRALDALRALKARLWSSRQQRWPQ